MIAYILVVCAAVYAPSCHETKYPSADQCYAALNRVRFYNQSRDYAYCRPAQ